MWVDNGLGGWRWDGPVPPEGLPPRPLGPSGSSGDSFQFLGGNAGQAQQTVDPGSYVSPYADDPATMGSNPRDAVERAQDHYTTVATQRSSTTPLATESAAQYETRMRSMGYATVGAPYTGETAAQYQVRNRQEQADKYGTTPAPTPAPRTNTNVAQPAYVPPNLAEQQKSNVTRTQQADATRNVDANKVIKGYQDATKLDTSAADESRQLQRDVFDRQTSIIQRELDFDPDVYAQTFADQSLNALNANARSARGGQGAVNAALFSAQAQAPELFARGAQQAAQLESERLQAAGNIAAQSGQLATDVRQGDESRSQFLSDLGLRAQQGIAQIVGQDMQLDAAATRDLGEFAVEFAKIYQQGQALTLQAQIATMDDLTRRYGTDAQTRVALAGIRAQLEAGKIGWDDIGLALLSVGGQVGAAAAGKP